MPNTYPVRLCLSLVLLQKISIGQLEQAFISLQVEELTPAFGFLTFLDQFADAPIAGGIYNVMY